MRLLIICFTLSLFSCQSNKFNKPTPEVKKAKRELYGNTQGTTYSIIINDEIDVSKKEIDSILNEFDQELSTYLDSSFISKFNVLSSGKIEYVSENHFFENCLKMSAEVFKTSKGKFDPSIMPLVDAWSFFRKDHKTIPDSSLVDSLRSLLGLTNGKHFTYNSDEFQYLNKITPGFRLDFNAIAQGYSVDVIYDYLKEKGANSFYVEIGGELRVEGEKIDGNPWVIAIEEPNEDERREMMTYLKLDGKALATSGNYRKFYEKNGIKYSHTIDPYSGYPVKHSLLSATVVTEECSMADAYATMFMVLGVDKSMEFVKEHPELNLAVYFIFDNENGRMEVAYNKSFEELLFD